MSSRDKDNGEVLIFVIIMCAILAVFAAIYAYFFFYTLILTGVCIYAWNEPRDFENSTIFPDEARAFIIRGVVACAIALIVTKIGVDHHRWKVTEGGWWFIAVTAYMGGSTFIESLRSPTDAAGDPDFFPKRHIPTPIAPPVGPVIEATATEIEPEPEAPKFAFADWDDDEVRS